MENMSQSGGSPLNGIYDRRNNILKSEIISATPVDLKENRQEDQIKDAVTQHPEVVYRALTSKETQHSTILYVILFAAYLIVDYGGLSCIHKTYLNRAGIQDMTAFPK
ncbi:uncharacterized protein LOC119648578 [Hermetia illucens]|uniref:uncharacterized protein LOC119648578 n=1 Tax=Hermetia illucens TaxID=343691 RepID=UPI0018CC4D19|nr:uncharacterized protein LOC119648578 [Hermetia illucens]